VSTTPSTDSGLPQQSANGKARAAALTAAANVAAKPTSLVSYRSAGALVIIGPGATAFEVAERLPAELHCTVVVDELGGESAASNLAKAPRGVTVAREKVVQVSGHLGQFAVVVSAPPPQGGINLLQKLANQRTHFDLVLDLTDPPFLRDALPPFGYYAPRRDPEALERVLGELPDMIGEFEKPRYFNYNPDICAHGASGLTGCTRCIEVCPAGAIISINEEVAVDPYRCQGAGACATACPTGAMRYAYPSAADHLAKLASLLKTYRASQGALPVILYHDAESGKERASALYGSLPENVIPIEVAELGSVGMDTWLAALAYGAGRVALLPTASTPEQVIAEVKSQIAYSEAILKGMGYAANAIAWLDGDDAAALAALANSEQPIASPAAFSSFDDKRTNLRLAIEHLYEHAPSRQKITALPRGAPFGEILVNRDACTLCMSCVGVCPAAALADGEDLPQLKFVEGNCVQCGLCATACPEDAIRLLPRYLYDPSERRTARILNEEAPFHCVSCGKPFATQKMIDSMTEKLKGHWMFQSGDALHRVQMCGDCRVREMFKAERQRPETI
jgi:ferredoxin